jgi:hypothetical protein
MNTNITIDFRAINLFRERFHNEINNIDEGPLKSAMLYAAKYIQSYWQHWTIDGGNNWIRNSASTIKRKGFDSPYVSIRSDFLKALGNKTTFKNGIMYVGIEDDLYQLAEWLDVGTKNIPSRPLVPNPIEQISVNEFIQTGINNLVGECNVSVGL